MRVLQVNTVYNAGSTGRIAADINNFLKKNCFESYVAYGRGSVSIEDGIIKIGNKVDNYIHALGTRLLDKHGLFSTNATNEAIEVFKEINPDIIHLHNIHGYYLNIEALFKFLEAIKKPVVWTLHDCWSFTGHCAYFDYAQCDKWKTKCHQCSEKMSYPTSFFADESETNYELKKKLFNSIKDLYIVTPSKWLKELVGNSFLSRYDTETINNGVDLNVFKPHENSFCAQYNVGNKSIVLGVANVWDRRKGYPYMISLAEKLPSSCQLVLVGLTKRQVDHLPNNIIGITRTDDIYELADIYASATVYVNTTLEDNFPTTNLEALASGTPVITFSSGGSGECILDSSCGYIVEQGNVEEIIRKILLIKDSPKEKYEKICRERAVQLYSKELALKKYVDLYEKIYMKEVRG